MSMDAVLKQLESRIEELLAAYNKATARETELAGRVEELEAQVATGSEAGERVTALEKQRDELAERLEKVLALIDGALDKS